MNIVFGTIVKVVIGLATFSTCIVVYIILIRRAGTSHIFELHIRCQSNIAQW